MYDMMTMMDGLGGFLMMFWMFVGTTLWILLLVVLIWALLRWLNGRWPQKQAPMSNTPVSPIE